MPKGGTVGLRGKSSLRDAPFGLRKDGTPKGLGFLGKIPTGRGDKVMTEQSMGIEMDGKEVLIPLIIPSSTPEELDLLKKSTKPEDLPEAMRQKAIDHAMDRMRKGLSPFAD